MFSSNVIIINCPWYDAILGNEFDCLEAAL